MDDQSSRREFLKAVTALGAAGVPIAKGAPAVPVVGAARVPSANGAASAPGACDATPMQGATSVHRHLAQLAPPILARTPGETETYGFFSAAEATFVEAALASLIPNDDLGPGAREAGVAYFIDRELAGAFGAHARNYRQGPWPEGSIEQGFQSPLTPKQIYRAAIAETNLVCRSRYGKTFDDLELRQREQVLKGLESGALVLESVSAQLFFGLLLTNTQEGFFADPLYGGNRDKAGWALVGFPGVAAAYIDEIEKHNVPYRVVPVSIGDIEQGHSPTDAHGHAIHTRIDKQPTRIDKPFEGRDR